MLHFAYGSNMSRALMGRRCPQARPLGPATLRGWRFVISPQGYASIVPARGGVVQGVLWALGPRDLAAINAYESIDTGLYRRRWLAVRRGGRGGGQRDCRQVLALAFVGRRGAAGYPRPGYLEIVVAAARDWCLPDQYVRALGRWSRSAWHGSRVPEAGERR